MSQTHTLDDPPAGYEYAFSNLGIDTAANGSIFHDDHWKTMDSILNEIYKAESGPGDPDDYSFTRFTPAEIKTELESYGFTFTTV